MPTNRMGYASFNTGANSGKPIPLRSRMRSVPIIIVPGFLGSRLSDGKSLAWNPTGFPLSIMSGSTPGSFKCDFTRLQQISAELQPDTQTKYDDPADDAKVKHITNYYHLVTPFYGALARALAQQPPVVKNAGPTSPPPPPPPTGFAGAMAAVGSFMKGADEAPPNDDPDYLLIKSNGATGDPLVQLRPQVYCCGYDWRQDNATSALRLAQVVDQALQETGERQCIIVAHGTGGHVARYYSRMLGGEQKVFAMLLIGSPIMGLPGAYSQLKHGPHGIYAKGYLQDALGVNKNAPGPTADQNHGDVVEDDPLYDIAIAAEAGLDMLAGASPLDAIKGALGEVLLILELGAGRLLKRSEAIYFVRQMPSIYQQMPNPIFCVAHNNWLLFDPLNTGLSPVGKIVIFPTLLGITHLQNTAQAGSTVASATSKAAAGQKYIAAGGGWVYQAAQDGTPQMPSWQEPGDRSNAGLTSANTLTLDQLMSKIFTTSTDPSSGKVTQSDWDKWGPSGTTGTQDKPSTLFQDLKSLTDRAQATFADCTEQGKLYDDIFTGLQDIVPLRAISAANVKLASQFENALLTNAPSAKAPNVATAVLGMVGSAISALGHAISPSNKAFDSKDSGNGKAYVHPRTVIYASNSQLGDGGSLLACKDVLSNYDYNFTTWQLLPNLVGAAAAAAVARFGSPPTDPSSTMALYLGDGTVPYFSANPPPDLVSAKWDATTGADGKAVGKNDCKLQHNALTSDGDLIQKIKKDITALMTDWWKT